MAPPNGDHERHDPRHRQTEHEQQRNGEADDPERVGVQEQRGKESQQEQEQDERPRCQVPQENPLAPGH
jgi:hypothetical protein